MYPPFTIVARMAGSDYKIPDTTIVLKKGVPIFIPVYAIHVSGMDAQEYNYCTAPKALLNC